MLTCGVGDLHVARGGRRYLRRGYSGLGLGAGLRLGPGIIGVVALLLRGVPHGP